MTILGDVVDASSVPTDEDFFNKELLVWINSAVSTMSTLGVTEFDNLVVRMNTDWPSFSGNETLLGLCQAYVAAKVKLAFDPPSIGALNQTLREHVRELEGRIELQVTGGDS
jgi:hypothetical protein